MNIYKKKFGPKVINFFRIIKNYNLRSFILALYDDQNEIDIKGNLEHKKITMIYIFASLGSEFYHFLPSKGTTV